jgi:ABC-type bacteriocin/lantibiotic exporter with double-glycine peptidase domain
MNGFLLGMVKMLPWLLIMSRWSKPDFNEINIYHIYKWTFRWISLFFVCLFVCLFVYFAFSILNKWHRKLKWQSRIDNSETLETLGTRFRMNTNQNNNTTQKAKHMNTRNTPKQGVNLCACERVNSSESDKTYAVLLVQ